MINIKTIDFLEKKIKKIENKEMIPRKIDSSLEYYKELLVLHKGNKIPKNYNVILKKEDKKERKRMYNIVSGLIADWRVLNLIKSISKN